MASVGESNVNLLQRRIAELESTIAGMKSAEQDLVRREHDLQDFVENAPVAIHWVGADGTILWANQAELTLLGYSPEEYIGRNIAEFHVDQPVIIDILERLKRNEALKGYESRVRCKDGSIRFVSIYSNVHWENGRFVHTRCFTRDITHEVRTRDIQQRFASIVESSDDAIISKSLDGTILSWNDGAQRMFGYTAEETVGQHISMLAAPDRLHEMPRILERIARGEHVRYYQTRRRAKDGRILTVSLSVSPIRDASGQIIGASKIARDITDYRRVTELQEQLAAIVESSDDAIIGKSLEGIIQSWNQGAQRIFGYTPDEVIGRHVSMLAVPDRMDEIPRILQRIAAGERVEHYQTKRRTKDGKVLTVSLTVSPVRDASGVIIGASKIARDVTESEQHRQALEEANAALLQANADLQQFAYSASHDLQEPLRMVSTYSALLKKKFGGQLGESGDQYIRYAIEGAERMQRLLDDLLAFTRASALEQEPPPQLDVDRALDAALNNLQSVIQESAATITRTSLPTVRIHEFQMQQLFQNLVGNAIRYRSGQPPRIHIAAEPADDRWQFSVEDNGIGIDRKYQEQIFGIFKRLHSSADYPGTGMGLAICQRIVQRAGGRIWVESQPGRGSTFFFTLPG